MRRVGPSRWKTCLRILYCVPSLATGGAERRAATLAGHMARRGHTVRLVTAHGLGPMATLCDERVEFCDLGVGLPFFRHGIPALRQAIREWRPDVFHGFGNVGLYWGPVIARLLQVKAVVGSVGNVPVGTADWRRGERTLGRITMRFAHCITVNSRGVERYVRASLRWLGPEVRLIPNHLDLAAIPYRDAALRDDVRAELGVGPDEPLCGTVGRMVEAKNHRGLVEGFARLLSTLPTARLAIVGDGPWRADTEAAIGEHGVADRVILLGERRDVPRLLQGFDLFVLPSVREGMPNALLEAMAAGLAAVGTAVPGTEDLIEPGATGWLVPLRDAEALACALAEALSDRARLAQMGAEARRRVEQQYDYEVVMAQYQQLYEDLLARLGRV